MEKYAIRKFTFLLSAESSSRSGQNAGQATLEYLFVIVLGVVVALLFYNGTLAMYDQAVTNLGGRLEANLRSGRLPANQWAKDN